MSVPPVNSGKSDNLSGHILDFGPGSHKLAC